MDKTDVLAWLKRRGSRRNVLGMARYGIRAARVFGVSVGTLQSLAKQLGKDHALATALWRSGWYEARLLAALVDDAERVTRRQMNAWAAGFENWADCDTVCFHLFDRTPFAWEKTRQWAKSPREFVKRAAFALMACLALHDKAAPDKRFLAMLPLIEKGARDERNFVKKAVSWALRSIGRRNVALNAAAVAVAKRLALSEDSAPRWIGRDALRELASPNVRSQLARQARGAPATRR
ncbi:MAG TPA: DNA alkylation repair protein [Gemmatimonadales bacterium]|nr:DNA alkylation repair protein [Gemmatimonadales bacterium]